MRESLEEKHSDINSETDLYFSFAESNITELDSDEESLEEAYKSSTSISGDQREKQFYAICLKKKLKNSETRLSKDISIADLYKNCQEERIPIEK